jgi:hypothetical protein
MVLRGKGGRAVKRQGGGSTPVTPKQVIQTIKDKGVVMVDVKFMDLLGTW